MRILVISDTHGNYPQALRAETEAGGADVVIHLGDGANDAQLLAHALDVELLSVSGNCDLGAVAPREIVCEFEGKRLFLTHGDRYGVKHGLERLKQRGLELRADVILFGHTHSALVCQSSGLLLVNPGSLSHTSSHKSFALLEITAGSVNASLHELGICSGP